MISIKLKILGKDSWITVHGRNANSARLTGLEKRQSVDRSESRKGVLGGRNCLRKGIEAGMRLYIARKSLQQKKARLLLSLTCLNMTSKIWTQIICSLFLILFVCFNRFLRFFLKIEMLVYIRKLFI